MATTKKKEDAPEQVLLRCEDLGETRPFEPAHAERLLNWQQERGLAGNAAWQPVSTDLARTDA